MPVQTLASVATSIKNSKLAVDTNILIYYLDTSHVKNRRITPVIEQLISAGNTLVYFVATKLELYHYFSKKLFEQFAFSYSGHLPTKIEGLADSISEAKAQPGYLNQQDIKSIRELFLQHEKGLDYWKEFLRKSMAKVQQNIDTINQHPAIKYNTKKDLPDESKLSWQGVEELITGHLFGSNDAAILNMFQASGIDHLISADSDFKYIFNAKNITNKTLLTV